MKSIPIEKKARHQCMIYSGAPSQQLTALTTTIHQRLNEGHRCLYLNSPNMIAGFRSCLAERGIDVVSEISKGRLVLSSEPVASPDGTFNTELMLQNLESALDQALSDGHKGLFATGDMTWEFGSENNFYKLMDYERGLENLFRKRQELNGICQYHKDTLPLEVVRQGVLTHRTLFINETLSRINPHYFSESLLSKKMASNAELDELIISLCSN